MNDSTRMTRMGYPALAISIVLLLLLPSHLQLFMGEEIDYLGGLLFRGLFALVMLAALVPIARSRAALLAGGLLALPVLASHWLFDDRAMLYRALAELVFSGYICACLLGALVRARQANAETISATICLYLLAGISWALLYGVLELRFPGSFNNVTVELGPYHMLGELIYFSFVTMSTLGYGDITAVTPTARSWVFLQSVFGQFYIAVVVARLVALQLVEFGNGSQASGG